MYNILILGAGQLGSRHLQSLSYLNIKVRIFVCDISNKSLSITKNRFLEMPSNPNVVSVEYFTSIEEISSEIDLAIIATNANVRFDITCELLHHIKVKNIVFEKVLFQKIDHYDLMQEMLDKYNIKAWVNCPRRMYPYYKNIKNQINKRNLAITVTGGHWGLGCNAIHYIDLFAFLTDSLDIKCFSNLLNKDSMPSKRKNFIEISGCLSVKNSDESIMNLVSLHNSTASDSITIISDDVRFDIYEGKVELIKTSFDSTVSKENYEVLYQSKLSHVFTEGILLKGTCDLTDFETSSILHKEFIQCVLDHINEYSDIKTDICNIT